MLVVGPAAGLADWGAAVQESAGADLVFLAGAGVIITIAAGARRSAARDFELAGVAWIPCFALNAAARLGFELLGVRAGRGATDALGLATLAALLLGVALAIRHARSRT
jgi:hypothetical protein